MKNKKYNKENKANKESRQNIHSHRLTAALLILVLSLTMWPATALADYEEELEWSQMEADLLEGNSVEWHMYEEAQADEAAPQWRIAIDTEQLDLLERCVMAEGGGESYECQRAIACVIVNRVLSENYPNTVEGVIKQDGQFSTWPSQIRRAAATDEVKQAVREALTSAAIPENVFYFRSDYYHHWATDYCKIDNTWFSTP